MITAVIFDVDGVLVDTEEFHKEAYKEIAMLFQVEIAPDKLNEFMGRSADDNIKDIIKDYMQESDVGHYAARKDSIYRKKIGDVKPLSGIETFIKSLKDAGFKLGVASAGSRANVELIMKKSGLSKYFDFWLSANDVERPKPDPEVYLKAADLLGEHPEDCLVIEDSPTGITAAKRAGMKCFALTTTLSKEELNEADKIFDSPKEITVEIINNS